MDPSQSISSELHELERLAVLEAASLLDTQEEETFDRLTRLASTILKIPVALVSLVDKDRQFFKSSVGLSEPWVTRRETPLTHSFCKHVVSCSEILSVVDARTHPLLKNNLAISELGVIAYLGIPLTTAQGHTLGSFCAIDTEPHEWSPQDVAVLRDLAALVIEKIELRLVAKQLHTDYLKLRKLELYREEMVQMLVHDLRNPLTSFLSGLALTELSGGLTDLQQKYISLAHEGGKTLSQMITNILDISKAESGQLELDLAEVEAAQLIGPVCRQMEPLADKAGVRLLCDPAGAGPLVADAERLRRVLINLVSNAIQNTPSGGSITVGVQIEKGSEARHLTVTDTGRGIPSEAFEKIFQKFGCTQSRSVSGDSTGLGLPFSRMVVEAHGGRIWVESELGQGTTFHFTIPHHSPL